MTAEQLATYFGKKIARPHSLRLSEETPPGWVFWIYELEVTAVEEGILHVTVFLKGCVPKRGVGCGGTT